MIIEFLVNAICTLITGIFSILPDLPHFDGLEHSLDTVLSVIMSHMQLLDIFIRPGTIKVVIPFLILILNFEHVWNFLMFLLRKLPINIS